MSGPYEPPSGQTPYGYGYPAPGNPGQPQAYPWQPQAYGPRKARNGLAITSMVLGILALVTCWLTFPGIVLGILAVIFGGVGIARARGDRVSNMGMAIAGLITGIIGAVIGTVLFIFAFQIASDCQDQFGTQITDQELQQCIQDKVGN